jgi:hypothetical protein
LEAVSEFTLRKSGTSRQSDFWWLLHQMIGEPLQIQNFADQPDCSFLPLPNAEFIYTK